MNVNKNIVTLASVFLILGSAVGAYMLMTKKPVEVRVEETEEKKWVVQTRPVINGNFQPELQLVGLVRSANNQILNSKISSEVTHINYRNGSLVQKDDVVIQLDNQELLEQLESAIADHEYSKAAIEIATNNNKLNVQMFRIEKKQLDQTKNDLVNLRKLVLENLASQTQIDQKQAEVDSRQFAVLTRKIQLENYSPQLKQLISQQDKALVNQKRIERQIENCHIKAPFDGRLTELISQVGQKVSPGQQLAVIYNSNVMEIEAQLPIQLLSSLNSETNDKLTGWLVQQNKQIPVSLVSVSGSVEAGFASQQAVFSIDARKHGLTPGQSVSFIINARAVNNGFLIPELALFENGRVYRINSESRLEALDVDVIGRTNKEGSYYIATSGDLNSDDELLVTRLANAVNNLWVISPEAAEVERLAKLELETLNEKEAE